MKISFLISNAPGGLMKMLKYNLAAVVMALLLPAFAAAAPKMINYQGRLIDNTGNPLVGAQTIYFKLYHQAVGGTDFWAETQTVTPDNGIFSVALGSFTALPESDFLSDSVYLGVRIDPDVAELSPRTRLMASPYALYTSHLGSSLSQSLISTDTIISASQLRLGNFSSEPGGVGPGALIYDTVGVVKYYNGTNWVTFSAGGAATWNSGSGALTLINPTDKVGIGKVPALKLDVAGDIRSDYGIFGATMALAGAGVDALVVAGGIKAGTPSVQIVNADGSMPALSPMNAALSTGVYTTQFYADPAWLTSLATAKVDLSTVTTAINNANSSASASIAPIQAAISTAVYNVNFYANPSWITSLATSKIDLSTVTAEIAPLQTAAGNAAYITNSYPNPVWITSLATAKIDLSTVTAAINSGLSPVNAALSTGVYTTQSYANPAWLTSLATSKIDLSTVAAIVQPIEAAISTAVYNVNFYANPSWITSLATSKIDLSTVAAIVAPVQAAISTAVYNVNFYANPSWITSLATSKIDLSTVTTALSNADNLTSGTLASARLSGTYSNALTFGSAAGGPISFSTHVVLSASQMRIGNYAAAPVAVGAGSMYYDNVAQLLYYSNNGLSWTALAAGGASPWTSGGGATTLVTASDRVGVGKAPTEKLDVAGTIKSDFGVAAATMTLSDTGASALKVSGGITAGSGNVAIVDTTGKIPALTSTYFASLNGSALTNITASAIAAGNITAGSLLNTVIASSIAVNSITDQNQITDGVITNADLNASAAIADTKLGTISTAGKVNPGAIAAGSLLNTVMVSSIVVNSITDQNQILDGVLMNSDLNASAAIAISKLATTGTLGANVMVSSIVVNSITDQNQIQDGVIMNADINASAAIADTKLGTISTAGKVNPGAIAAGSLLNTVMVSSIVVNSITNQNQITDGVIMDSDLNASAAVAISKLATTGTLGANVIVSSIAVNAIKDQNQIQDGIIMDSDLNASAAVAISKLATTGTLGANVIVSSIAVNAIKDQNQIQDGIIMDSDLNASAAIAISKLATTGTLGADVVASSVPAGNIGVGVLSAAVVVSSVGVNAVHTGAISDSAVTDAKISGMAASKLTGSIPQALTVFSDADCDALTPAAEGQFCYDSVKHMLSVSTSTNLGGYAGIAMDAVSTW